MHNLLYTSWADRPGVYMEILYINFKKLTRNVRMYMSLDTEKDCDLLH
jgi:hypothetical protein